MNTEVSRIFVKGLPPSLAESDFRKHFEAVGSVTDTKLFPHRRIGYVGYETPRAAEKAVKYFNRTFIRMSKLSVDLARPVIQEPTRSTQYDHPGPMTDGQRLQRTGNMSEGERGLKRKREQREAPPTDAKLEEYLDVMRGRTDTKSASTATKETRPSVEASTAVACVEAASDDEYEAIPKKTKTLRPDEDETHTAKVEIQSGQQITTPLAAHTFINAITSEDSAWLRERTNRALESDIQSSNEAGPQRKDESPAHLAPLPGSSTTNDALPLVESHDEPNVSEQSAEESKIRDSKRLFIRNLAYGLEEGNLRQLFADFVSVTEVHIPIDTKTRVSKGYAYVAFEDSDEAVTAWRALDGKTLNGRLLHILPSANKRETQLDEFAMSKLPLKKQQQIKRRREASSTTFNWNSLYMNSDAIMSSVADRLGVAKSTLLDPTSSDAAIKQAHAETYVIQQTKSFFESHGVKLESFNSSKRGDTAILIKNFPYNAKSNDLRTLFEQHGRLKRFLMPPNGTIAIVEFETAPQARSAFAALAYRKIGDSVLFLERAPVDVFNNKEEIDERRREAGTMMHNPPLETSGDMTQTDEARVGPTATLFVRNLAFVTTTERLDEVFRPLEGFLSARVKTKTDPKKPGEILSMGFGFLEFKSIRHAQTALEAMDGHNLDGHELQIRTSHKGRDAAEQSKRQDDARKQAAKRAKIVIKNLPFEASKKDVRALVTPFGQLRSVRVPKKIDHAARGFAFAEFTSAKEAENAIDALKDTHLLGRRLVIDYAAEDPEDAEAEIERMQSKMGSQLNKVEVQKLMGDGRRKFAVSSTENEEVV